MKLISLHEPWATLFALGAKRIETRSWNTPYRGWLAIQASKGGLKSDELEETCQERAMRTALATDPDVNAWLTAPPELDGRRPSARHWKGRGAFPFGKIVAVVNLVECCPTDVVFVKYPLLDSLKERAVGNFEPGRWAWVTDKLFRLSPPLAFAARQGLCDVDERTVLEIRRQWQARKAGAKA